MKQKINSKPARVDYADIGEVAIPKPKPLARLAEKVLRGEGISGMVNLVFCPDSQVRALNKRYRKLDKVTDVLSFVYGDDDVWGEIYIASEQARRQAPRWKNTLYDELRRLVVHGALHLAGHDHMAAKERKAMRAKEDEYLASSP